MEVQYVEQAIKLLTIVLSIYEFDVGELPGRDRITYSCALTRGTLSTCLSDTPIMGSGHLLLYPLDTVPTHPRRALGFAACGSTRRELSSCIYHGRTILWCLLSWCLLV